MKQIFLDILIRPSKGFGDLLESNYDKFIIPVLFLAAIPNAISRASAVNMGDGRTLLEVMGLTIISGGLFGIAFFFVYIRLVKWTGRWFKGKAETISIKKIYAASMIPMAMRLVIYALFILRFGNDFFQGHFNIEFYSSTEVIIFSVLNVIDAFLILWSLVLVVIGLSIAQKISILRAIINHVLPAVIIMLAMTTIYLIKFSLEQIY